MFQLYKEAIKLDEKEIKTPAIKELIKELGDKKALPIILFIFLVSDRSDDNPIKDFPEVERILEAKEIAFGDDQLDLRKEYPKEIKMINNAIKQYKNEKIDKIQKDIDLYDKKMYQFITLLDDVGNEPEIVRNIHDISGRITFSTNIDIINTILDNAIHIILDKASLVSMKKTGRFTGSLRGGLSPNTTGKLKH